MFYRLEDAALILTQKGIPTNYRQMQRLVKAGKVRARKVGVRWFIAESALDEFLAA